MIGLSPDPCSESVADSAAWCHGCGSDRVPLVTVCGSYEEVADHLRGSFACRACLTTALNALDEEECAPAAVVVPLLGRLAEFERALREAREARGVAPTFEAAVSGEGPLLP